MTQIPQHITSIPGIGSVTGVVLLAKIGEVNRFERMEELVACAGIDPRPTQPGSSRPPRRI